MNSLGFRESLAQYFKNLQVLRPGACWWITYSGGLDSTVLLSILQQWCQSNGQRLRAVHVNHGYSPISETWTHHCQDQCDALAVPLVQITLDCEQHEKSSQCLEAFWRDQRYQSFIECSAEKDIIFLAHHQQDQVETMLMRLFRGAGVRGLGAMKQSTCWGERYWERPLLAWDQTSLSNYARHCQLTWIEDPSNQNSRFQRNFIRHQVLPLIEERWPGALQSIFRSSSHCSSDSQLLDRYLHQEMAPFLLQDHSLCLRYWQDQPELKQIPLLRVWLQYFEPYGLPTSQWNTLKTQLQVWHSNMQIQWKTEKGSIRVYQKRLYWLASHSVQSLIKSQPKPWALHKPSCCAFGSYVFNHTSSQNGEALIALRHGLGPLRLADNRPRQSLKKIHQSLGVPPWLRDSLPSVIQGGCVLMIPGYYCHPDWQASLSYTNSHQSVDAD